MSRVGRQPIAIPSGVEVKVSKEAVSVKGAKGSLEVKLFADIAAKQEDTNLLITRSSEMKEVRAMHGTTRALVQNAIKGVSEGYEKKLEIQGVGYRVILKGKQLVFNIGFCHTVEYDAPEGISFACPDQTHIDVSGIDSQKVGQVAAEIRAIRKPESYKGKGIRYVGEVVRLKAGKAGK